MNWKTLFKDVFSLLAGIFTGFPRQLSSKTLNYFHCYNSAKEVKKYCSYLKLKIEIRKKKLPLSNISYLEYLTSQTLLSIWSLHMLGIEGLLYLSV